MRSPRSAAVAALLSLVVPLTLSHTALAQRSPGIRAGGFFGAPARRPFAQPFRGGFIGRGFRSRLANGFPAGPMLGPIGFGFPPRGELLGVPTRFGFFGFPNGFGFFGFPNRFGFFGFPHGRFGFFLFNRFPFGEFAFFHGLPFATGVFFQGVPFFPGFPRRPFGFFGLPAFPFGVAPFPLGPGFLAGTVVADAPAVYGADTVTARASPRGPDIWPTLGRQVAAPGIAPGAGDSLVVERVSVMDVVPATVLRLTWRSSGLEAAQVALFLADSAQAVLASQTLRGPPFTALLDPPPETAYAGVTAMWPDGTTSSRLVPYRARPR
jgi:hypothetical protein